MAVSGSILLKKIDDSKPLNIRSKAKNTLGDSLSYIGQKAGVGLAGTVEGITKLPGLIENTFTGNGAYAARMAGTGVVDKWRRNLEEEYNPDGFLSFLGSAAEGVGQSSTFLLNAIPGMQGVGSATFFTGILGNSIENASATTGDLGFKEWGYGTTVAAAEWLLEKISGAGGQAAKVLAGKTAKSLGKTAVYEAVRNSIGKEILSEAAGEFVEEFLGDYVDVGAQRLFGIDKNATVSLKEALYSGLVGALSGFAMASGTSAISSTVKIAAGNKVKANGNVDTLLKMADAVSNEFKSSKVGEGFGGNMNGRMNELIQNLQASTRAYQNLSPEAQNSARGSLILGEIQSSMTMLETSEAVEFETQKVKANAELYAEYAKALTDGKVQYTAEDILENKNNITTQLAVMRFAREMLTPGEVTMARDRVSRAIQDELVARGIKITEEIANGKTVDEATAEADKSPLTENTRLITDFSTTNPAGTYKVYGDKFIDVTEDTDDNGNVTGYTLYYSDSDTADKGLSVEELSSRIGSIVDTNFDAVNKEMLDSFTAEKTEESKNTAEEKNAAGSEKSSEKQYSIKDTISNIVSRVGGNKKQTLSKEELSDRASRAAIQDKARKAVDGFDLLDVERRMAIEYMYESAAQNGISQKDADVCAALMSKLNSDIGFANIENEKINGFHTWIDNHSVIVLNANKNISVSLAWALAHESAHSLEKSAGYDALAKDVLKYSSKEYQQATIDTYKNADPDMSDEDIQKEVVADSLASILLQGKKLESLVAQNQSILSRAFRWITNFAKTFKNKNKFATAVINRIARQYGNALGYNRVQAISDVATVVIGNKAASRYKNAKEQKAETKRLTEIGIDQGVNYEGFTINADNAVFEDGADRTKLGYAVNNVNMIYSEAENKILLQTIIGVDKVYCTECEADVEGKSLKVIRAYISDDLQVNESADERGDIQFSIALNGKITKAQQTYLDKNKTNVSQEQLDTAKEQETRVAERLKGMSDILPEDTPGNVIRSNGSYGKSIENTTICVRTLVYNAFVEKVQKIINRPMTAMESFLVSQKLYDIAVDPQCLYCYVSLDRKAYYDYAIKYLKNRDALIEEYKKLGIDTVPKSSRLKAELKEAIKNPQTEFDLLYKNWLKDRVPTVKSWSDFAYMIRSYHNGEKQLQLSDLATNESRTKAAQDSVLDKQLQMALRYAQSASYAKAQIEYESYNGNILKMSQDLVNELNQHYGLRWYSFSDFTAAFVLENMQQFTDAALRGLKGLAYTKDINFVKIFAPTGCNINVSTFVKKDKNGNYYLDKRQSANVISEDGSTISDEMKALKKKYPNVGIVVTATDDGGVEWALNQDWSDVVIPFHIVKTGQEVADYYGWKNFSHSQKDYVVDKAKWEEARAKLGRKQSDTDVMPSEHNNDKATYMRLLEERGLKPRFEAFINNPNYMKLVNECRQNGDQTEFLKAEFDYGAIDGVLDQFVEKGGYFDGWYNEGVDADAEAKIVADDIIDGRTADEVIYGNQRYTPEEVMAKRRTNRQHRGSQYSLTEKERQAEAIEYSDINVRYSISPDGYNGKTLTAYKAFYAYDGHLYPPMVSNLSEEKQKLVKNKIKGNESGTMRGLYTPLGVWLNADVGGIYLDKNGEVARNSKGRLQVKNDKGGGSLAFRPGWHLGEYPDAKQFNKEDENGNRTLMPANLVFAECEISADIDYQLEAMSYGVNRRGRFDRTQAGMPQVPVDGYYKYRTNPDPNTAPWYIAGSMKVNRILTDEEIKKLLPKGITMDRREGGIELTAEVLKNTYGIDAGVVSPETNIDAFKKNQRNIDNEKLLEQALNDERYADAYVKRDIDFNDPNVVNEFKINNLDINNYKPKVQYSLVDNSKYDFSKSFSEQIDDLYNGVFPSKDVLVIGGTPKVFQDIGFLQLPMFYLQDHAIDAFKNADGDHLGKDLLKEIPKALENPIAIIDSASVPGRLVAIVELPGQTRNTIAALDIDGNNTLNGKKTNGYLVVSAHERSNAKNLLRDAYESELKHQGGIYYIDKNRATILLAAAGVQFSGSSQTLNGSIRSIHDPLSKVKSNFNNIFETLQFKRWFGNSKAINKNGNPLTLYHWTNNDFDEFDTNKSGSNQGKTHGDGIYLSSSRDAFKYAGNKLLVGYASIQKPFEMQLTKGQARYVYAKYIEPFHPNDTFGTYRDHVLNALTSPIKVFDYLNEAAEKNNIKTSDILKDLGFDGVHDGIEWVAFDPNQFKSTDNIGTFDRNNNKFRYSLSNGKTENAIYIPDGTYSDGSTIDFINEILDGRKKGETRTHKSLTRKGWLGLAKDGYVYGRVRLGDPIPLTKDMQEYNDSLIEGTDYDIQDGQTKYYYPILEKEDFRDNPKPIIRNGNYGQFSLTPEQKLENEKDRLKAKNEYNQALKEFASQTGFQDAREVDAIGTRMFEGTSGEAQQYRNRARLLKTAAAMDFIAQYPNSENALKARKKVAETLRDLAIVSLYGKNSPLYQTDINLKERLSEFRNMLKNVRINVSNIRNDLAGGWDTFRKKNAFRLRLTTSDVNSYTADQIYNDMIAGNFDDLMNLNYSASMNEADLLNEIVRVLDIDPTYETMPFEEAVNNQISEMETAINLAIAHQRVNTEGYAEGIEEGIRRAVGKYGSVYRISDANRIVRDLDGVSINGVSVYNRSDYNPRRFLDRVIMDLNGAHDGNIEAVARVLAAEYIRQREFEINGDAPIFGSALMTDHPTVFNNLLEQYTKIIVNGWTKYGTDTRNTLLQGLLQIEKAAHRQDIKALKGVNRLANAFNRLNDISGKKKTSDVIDNAEMDAVGKMLTRILYQGNIVPKRVYQFAQAMESIFSKSEDNMTGTEIFLYRNMSEVSKETIKEILAQGENVAVDPQLVEALNGIAREIIHAYEHYGQVKISFDSSPATWQDAKPIAERGISQADNAFMSVKDNVVKKWITSGLINMGDPYRAAEMLENYASDPVLSKMVKDIIVSEAQATSNKIDYLKPFDEFFAENKKYKKHLTERFHSDYFNVDMSYGEAISLYCTMKREQAHRGLTDSQIIFQRDGKELRTSKASELLKKGVDQMTDTEKLMFITNGKSELFNNFTKEDKAFIDLVENFFNKVSTEAKMKADLDYYGRYLPMEDYYYPIAREQSSFNDNITDASKIAGQFVTYTNLSFNKATQKGAAKELYIKNVWDVVTNHAEGLSKYTTMWRPLTNFNYIWNDNVSEEVGIHKSMKKAYNDNVWDGTGEYFRKLFNDIQGLRDSKKPLDALMNKVRGGAVVFGLGFNPKVWLTQFTSLIACMDTLSPGAYLRGMAMYSPKNDEQMDKHSLYARVRDYDTEVVKAAGVIDQVGEAGQLTMKPIGWFDRQVIRMLWGVCQVQAEQQKGLAIGSEENMVEAGRLLDEAIMRNQQTAGSGTRSALMRGSELTKSLTMFTADSMKQFSSLVEAIGKYNRASRDVKNGVEGAEKVKAEAGRQLVKTSFAITGVATMMAVIASLFRHLYDKDRKKKANGEEMSVVEDIATESVGNVIGIIPLVSQVYGYLTDGYDLNDYTLDAVNDTLKYFSNVTGDVIDAAKGEKIESTTIAKDIRDALYGIGLAAGIPTRNMNNVLTALMKMLPGDADWQYKYTFKNPSYRKELDQAIANGDDSLATLVMKTWVEREKTGGSGDEVGRLLELYKQGYNIFGNNIPDKITVNGEDKELKAKDIKTITNYMTAAEDNLATIISKGVFTKVDDETEARAIRNYYTYNMDIAKEKVGADRTKYGVLSELYGAESISLVRAVASTSNIPEGKTKKEYVIETLDNLGLTDDIFKYIAGYKTDYAEETLKQQVYNYTNDPEIRRQMLAVLGIEA